MMKTFLRAAFVASLLSSTAVALSSPVQAADAKPATPTGPTVSKAVGIVLYDAQKLMTAGDYAGAMAKAKEAQLVPVRTPDDDYQINKFIGYIAINLKDNDAALAAFEALANSPVMPESDKAATYQNAMILNAIGKHYDRQIYYGLKLEAVKGSLDDKTYATLAQAYYLNNDPANAAVYSQKSVDAAKAKGVDADPVVLEILMSAQTKSNNTAAAIQTLEQIAVATNSPSEWSQLVDVALNAGGVRDLDALYIYRMRFMSGAMKTADDYTIMASIALQLGYATEAKEVLQQGINAGKISPGHGNAGGLLAQARSESVADERALPGIAAAAAKSKSGEQDVKLAEDYWGYGRYADAEASARRAIQKGGMKDPSEGNFILGIALVAQNKNIEAQDPLSKVSGSKGRTAAGHLWWLYAKGRARQQGQSNAAPAQ